MKKNSIDSMPNNHIKNSRLFLMYFLPPFIIYIIYLLAYFPGIMPNDGVYQWKEVLSFQFVDWHPVFHTLLEWLVSRIWVSPASIAIAQIIFLSFAYAYAMLQFDKMGIKRKYLLILTAIFALNPVNGTFAVTLIKDNPFISILIVLTVQLIKIFHTDGQWLKPLQNKIALVIVLVITALVRHNGMAPALATIFILLIFYRKHWKSIVSVALATGILIFAIKVPLYDALKVEPSNEVQPLVLGLVQVSAIAHFNGNVTDEEKKFLSKIASWKDWVNGYNKYTVYGITKAKSYHGKAFSKNRNQFIKTWITLVLRNPYIASKAYLHRTNMIWNPFTPADSSLKISNTIYKNNIGLKMEPILPGFKALSDLMSRAAASKYFSWFLLRPALYMYFIILMCILFIKRKKIKATLPFVPVLANTLGLAIVSTSSQPRYFYATILVSPFALFLYMYIKKDKREEEKQDPELNTAKKISILAATFSGNKGAASMLESIIDNVSARVKNIGFDVLSVYPKEDREQNPYKNARVVPCKAKQIVFRAFPLAILYAIFKWIPPIKKLLLKDPILNSLMKSDIVVDAAGISFVDSRSLIMNFYNYICMFVPLALGKKVIKFSQAMGPFKKFTNRMLAKRVLPRVDTICARGLITENHLKEIGLRNLELCADGAFVLPDQEAASKKTATEFKSAFFKTKIVGMSVSSVVYQYCKKAGIDYIGIMAAFIDYLSSNKGYNVLIIAQSARFGKDTLKNNDLVICKKVYELVKDKKKCKNLDSEMSPREIREYIGKCDLLVASRFHAMISSLYKKVPVFLIGWSHKYKEVLDMFGLGSYAVDYKVLSLNLLKEKFELFEHDTDKLRAKISENLEKVQKSSMKNIEIIVSKLDEPRDSK